MLSCIFDFHKKKHSCMYVITLGNERLGRTLLKLLVWSKARNSPAAVVPSFKVNVPLQAAAGCWWRMVKVMIYICNPCLVLTVVSGPVKSVRNMSAYWQGYSEDHQTQNRDLLICNHQLWVDEVNFSKMTKLKPNHGLLSPSLRYSHGEWVEGTSHDIQEADRSRFESTKVRGEAGILIEDRLTK